MMNRAKKIGVFMLVAMAFHVSGLAQDDAQFTLFPWATSYYNAGGIGEQNNTLCFTFLYDNKSLAWRDVYNGAGDSISKDKTAPQDFLLNIESYLKKLHGSIGLSLISDQIGYYKSIGVKLGYSYKLRIGGGHMGIGAQISFFNQQTDPSGFRPIDPNDPVLDNLSESTTDLDFGLGVHYTTDQWYAGVSVTQLAAAFDKDQKLRIAGDHGPARTPQMYFHGGYTWIVPANPNWEILPQTLVKTDFKTFQWDLMVLARYNGIYWGGLSYRLQDAVSLVFGARPFYNSSNVYLKGLDAGVSYSITTNKLGYRRYRSFGDVEVMVRYCFDIYKPEVFSGYGSTRSIYKNWY